MRVVAVAIAALALAVQMAAAARVERVHRRPSLAETANSLAYDVRGQGPATVVLINGDALDVRIWDAQVEPLMQHFRVLRYERNTAGPAIGLAQATEDLHELLENLQLPAVHLVAAGAGGDIAIDFATRYPEKVLRIAFTDPRLQQVGDDYPVLPDIPARACGVELAAALVGRAVGVDSRAVPATARLTAVVPARLVAPASLAGGAALEGLRDVARRVLVVTGTESRGAVTDALNLLARRVPGAETVRIFGAGSLANVEAPEVFNGVLLRFLLAP